MTSVNFPAGPDGNIGMGISSVDSDVCGLFVDIGEMNGLPWRGVDCMPLYANP
jgi:hypothetical protein